jgi:hypothetical protein
VCVTQEGAAAGEGQLCTVCIDELHKCDAGAMLPVTQQADLPHRACTFIELWWTLSIPGGVLKPKSHSFIVKRKV